MTGDPVQILIIDDEEDFSEGLADALVHDLQHQEGVSARIEIAKDIRLAGKLLERNLEFDPSFIICDIDFEQIQDALKRRDAGSDDEIKGGKEVGYVISGTVGNWRANTGRPSGQMGCFIYLVSGKHDFRSQAEADDRAVQVGANAFFRKADVDRGALFKRLVEDYRQVLASADAPPADGGDR